MKYLQDYKVFESKMKYQIVYHGSRYDFTYFSSNMIGSGEGNTGFGYGFYFTEDFEDAQSYASKLEREVGEGRIYTCKIPPKEYFLDLNEYFEDQSDFIQEKLLSIPDDIKVKIISDKFNYEDFIQDIEFEKDTPEYFQFIHEIINNEFINHGQGRDLFNHIKLNLPERYQDDEVVASDFLHSLGIKGMMHTNFTIRHFVVFDEEDIIIKKKNKLRNKY